MILRHYEELFCRENQIAPQIVFLGYKSKVSFEINKYMCVVLFYSPTQAAARGGTCGRESARWDRSKEAQRTRGEEKSSGEKANARNPTEDERKKRKCHPGIVGYWTRFPLWSTIVHWILPQSVSWEGNLLFLIFVSSTLSQINWNKFHVGSWFSRNSCIYFVLNRDHFSFLCWVISSSYMARGMQQIYLCIYYYTQTHTNY